MRLTKTGWNNVLIFASIGMILLFNATHNMISGDNAEPMRNEPMRLLPEDAMIMSIEFGAIKVERIGLGWRTNSKTQVNEDNLALLVQKWHQSELITTDISPSSQPLVAVIWLAGEPQGRTVQLFFEPQNAVVKVDQQYFKLLKPALSELILPGVL